MTAADERRWDERYRSGAGPVEGTVRRVLIDAQPWLTVAGRALDLACGTGAETCWLACRGWTVHAVDISGEALELARRRVAAAGCESRVDLVRADLDDGVPPAFAATAAGGYDLVVVGHFRWAALAAVVGERLRRGGLLVTSRLSEVGRRPAAGASGSPAFLAAPGELRRLAQQCGLEVLQIEEGEGETSLIARLP